MLMDYRLFVSIRVKGIVFDQRGLEELLPERSTAKLVVGEDETETRLFGAEKLLVTDDAVQAEDMSGQESGFLHLVYVGDYAQVAFMADKLTDIWEPGMDAERFAYRLTRLLRQLRDSFEADFYKRTLLTTINTVPDMMWYKRIDGIHMLVNDAFCEIVQKDKDDIHGKDHFYIWDVPKPTEGSADFACAESEEIAINTGRTYICDEPVKTREGLKQFTTYKTPVYDKHGSVFGTVGLGHDVTNFSNLGIELSILVENMPFPMTIFTADYKVVRMNSTFKSLTEVEDAESFDYRAWKEKHLVPNGERIEDESNHSAQREYQFVNSEGDTKIIIVTELEIRDFFDNVSGYFCTMQDITFHRAYEKSIVEMANTDMLTGMYNRRYFYSFLSNNYDRIFMLLYMDLDRFKLINDTLGHATGDAVLVKTARLIEEHFPGAICARLGGDEFALVDEKHDREYIERQSRHLEKAVQDAFSGYGLGTTISIGMTQTTGDEKDIDLIIHAGDEKMYEVKKKHHNEE